MPSSSTILVVEDDHHDSYLLARQLKQAQIDDNMTIVRDGWEAFDFLEHSERPPLAIFLDLKLPGQSGIEILETIKKNPRFQSIPVMIMTGSIDPIELKKCRQLGASEILAKPIALTSFIKAIAHIFPAASQSNPPE
jgi:CheY-like chemotaxis protein